MAAKSLRDIFNALIFDDEVVIITPDTAGLRSLRASLRTMKRRYNEGAGVGITGMKITKDILIQKHPDKEGLSVIKLGKRTARVMYECPEDESTTG